MSINTKRVAVYMCGGCNSPVASSAVLDGTKGIFGVVATNPDVMTSGENWFACGIGCVRPAVQAARTELKNRPAPAVDDTPQID